MFCFEYLFGNIILNGGGIYMENFVLLIWVLILFDFVYFVFFCDNVCFIFCCFVLSGEI